MQFFSIDALRIMDVAFGIGQGNNFAAEFGGFFGCILGNIS